MNLKYLVSVTGSNAYRKVNKLIETVTNKRHSIGAKYRSTLGWPETVSKELSIILFLLNGSL